MSNSHKYVKTGIDSGLKDGNHSAPLEEETVSIKDIQTAGLLPPLNSNDKGQNLSKRRSYGTINSQQSTTDPRASIGVEYIPYVAVNGDVPSADPEVVIDRRPLILVTVMIMLTVCAVRLHSTLMDQYLYSKFARVVFVNISVDTSRQPCVNSSTRVSSTTSEADLMNQVQDQASGMSLKLDLTSYGIGMLSNLLLGTYSCVMSRKLLLLIPSTGYFLRCALVPVVVHWDLDVTWFYLGYSIDGICGNSCGILLGTFLYTSDVTPRDSKRTLGISIVETVKGAVSSAFYVVTGQLIERIGYLIPSCAAAILQFLTVLVICILPDRKPLLSEEQREHTKSVKGALLHMFSPFHAQKERRVKWMIYLAVAAFFVTIIARLGMDKIQTLYVMNLPFCFDAITVGWFMFARDLTQHLFTIFAVICLFRCLPGMLLGIAGALSMAAACCMCAFAQFSWEIMYLVIILGIAQNIPFSIIRGESSRLLGSYYQGPLFASIAVLESIGYTAGATIFLSTYKATLDMFTGFAFLVGAGFMVVAAVVMCVYHGLWIGHVRRVQYNALTVSPPLSSENDPEKRQV